MSAHEETWTKVNAHVDRGIVDLVSALSEIPDLETLESCQGEQDKQDAFVIFRFGKWHKCGEFLFERLLSQMDDDIRSDVTLSIIGYDPTNCHGRISLVPAAVSRMASLVRAAAHAHWKWCSENEDVARVREGEMPKMTEPKTTRKHFPQGCTSAHRLANFMSQHIVGENFAAVDETCGICIEAVERFRAAVLATERERCLKLIEPYCNSSSLACRIADAIREEQNERQA